MAKVYTGKVTVAFDSVDDFTRMIEEGEKRREPFRNELINLLNGFEGHLKTKYVPKTVRKHTMIVELFIDFICRYTDANTIQEITRGMVNTHFKKWWKKKVWDSTTESELRVALRKFFSYLAEEHGILNENALLAFKIKGPGELTVYRANLPTGPGGESIDIEAMLELLDEILRAVVR